MKHFTLWLTNELTGALGSFSVFTKQIHHCSQVLKGNHF